MVYKKVSAILADILNLDTEDINPDTQLTPEFEFEMLDMAKLIIECEKKFKITVDDEKVCGFRTVKDIVKYIQNCLSENKGNNSESSDEERMWWYYS